MKSFPLSLSRSVLSAVLLLTFACSGPAGKPAEEGHAKMPASQGPNANQEASMAADAKTVHPDIVKRFCGQQEGPVPSLVKVLKDSSGDIGGYTHTLQVPDSPIYYLDRQGKDVAMFHIFGPDAEKEKNQPIIDDMRKAYPIETPLACP
jgi:hypothetical protein